MPMRGQTRDPAAGWTDRSFGEISYVTNATPLPWLTALRRSTRNRTNSCDEVLLA